ncbi:MAG TPA: transcription-repair coupling factor, partial [Tissierellaceae bacterium]|nr:transcription-repair coupling factor [Tissierellaceae bacterium]
MSNFLLDPLNNLQTYIELKKDIEDKKSPIATFGVIDESIGHIVYALQEHMDRQILLLTYDESKSRRLYEDIKSLGGQETYLLSKRELTFYDVDAFSSESGNERVNIVSRLIKGEKIILVASIEAILNKFMDASIFNSLSKNLKIGEEIDLSNIIELLVSGGYERVQMVEAIGQFSLRGGIFDFFPPESEYPYRIELFDNEIDSIRTFDILSQRSIEVLDIAYLTPVGEILILDEYREKIIKSMDKDLNKTLSKGKFKDLEKEKLENKFNKYREYLEEKMFISNKNLVLPYIPEDYLSSIINYLDENAIIFVDEPKRIEANIKDIKEDFVFKFTDLFYGGELLYSHENILYTYEYVLREIYKKTTVTSSAILGSSQSFNPVSIHNFNIKGMQSYHNKMELLSEDLNHFKYRGYKTIILSGTEERGKRLQKTLLEMDIEASFLDNKDEKIKSSQIFITTGSIKAGFEY